MSRGPAHLTEHGRTLGRRLVLHDGCQDALELIGIELASSGDG